LILTANFAHELNWQQKLIFIKMYKNKLLFFAGGLVVGAAIGLAVNNLALGMGVGAALGLIFARRARMRNS